MARRRHRDIDDELLDEQEVATEKAAVAPTSDAQERERRTKQELAKLRKLFRQIPDDRRQVVDGLIREAAWMRVTLEETRAVVDREGVVSQFVQGRQRFAREHPAAKLYAALINRYVLVVKSLLDLLPAQERAQQEDELMKFVRGSQRR